jgi:hypothetical protein
MSGLDETNRPKSASKVFSIDLVRWTSHDEIVSQACHHKVRPAFVSGLKSALSPDTGTGGTDLQHVGKLRAASTYFLRYGRPGTHACHANVN